MQLVARCSLAVLLVASTGAHAATIAADGVSCTLAEAIVGANLGNTQPGCSAGTAGADTIVLGYDVSLSVADGSSSLLAGNRAGLPDVTSTLTINAGAGTSIARSAALACDSVSAPFRLLNVTGSGNLTLVGLALTGGCAASAGAGGQGGAVYVASGSGGLTLQSCLLRNNRASGQTAMGGAVAAFAPLTLTRVDARDNVVTGAGSAGTALGGAVSLEGAGGTLLTIDDSLFEANSALGSGAAAATGGTARGGAVRATSVDYQISDSTFRSNVAQGGTPSSNGFVGGAAEGGALYLLGPSASSHLAGCVLTTNSALGGGSGNSSAGAARGGAVYAELRAEWNGLVLRDNHADGGATGATNAGGHGEGGGAYLIGLDPLAMVRNALFQLNRAKGGAVVNPSGQSTNGRGGGVYGSGQLRLHESTFIGNQAIGGTGQVIGGAGRGGGFFATGNQSLAVVNGTFSGNSATGGAASGGGANGGIGLGGGLYVDALPTVDVGSTTFGSNQAVGGAGSTQGTADGGGVYALGTVSIGNSLLATNTVNGSTTNADCHSDGSTNVSYGYNWADNVDLASCDFTKPGDQTGTPALGAVAAHGCVTALPDATCLPTIRATVSTDTGFCTAGPAVADDARGFDRQIDAVIGVNPSGDNCDPGAYEQQKVDLELSLTDSMDPLTVDAANSFAYVLMVFNGGSSAVTNLTLQLSLFFPTGVSLGPVAPPSSGTWNGTTRVWSISSLAAGATATLVLPVNLTTSTPRGIDVITVGAVVSNISEPATQPFLPVHQSTSTTSTSGMFGNGFESGTLAAWSASQH